MARFLSIIAVFLLSLLVLLEFGLAVQPQVVNQGGLPSTTIDCGKACSGRCRLSSRPHLCKRACGTCCARCSCVPPGTSGNGEKCPCYYNMKTHGNRPKCP
ncbi:hypothetical protein AMTR_s00041p00230770 [Amborella trichopoda]|uniref:Uncharacterized protein n=2 Tax=Amborella trichopoda TaxID=13333 RepID=W1PZM7_AMBTC|nr:hypothetical protein AMTR_s00041p00230770 [Amborella trichopoda]